MRLLKLVTKLFLLAELEEMSPPTTPKTDSTLIIASRNDEPENKHFTGHKTPNEAFKDGHETCEVIQETDKVLCDENRDSIEQENAHGDLLSSSAATEDTVAVDMLTHQTGISNRYRSFVYAGV